MAIRRLSRSFALTARDRNHRDDTDGILRSDASRASSLAMRRTVGSLRSRSRSSSDRSGSSRRAVVVRRIDRRAVSRPRRFSWRRGLQQIDDERPAFVGDCGQFATIQFALHSKDQVVTFDGGSRRANSFPKTTTQPVSIDCARHGLRADHITDLSRWFAGWCGDELKTAPFDTTACSEDRLERAGAAEPIQTRPIDARGRPDRQTAIRARPFARRADKTLRPPTVCMRLRKPCLRARRIFDG